MTMYKRKTNTDLKKIIDLFFSNINYYACSYIRAGKHKYQMIDSGYLSKGAGLGYVDT